ncbi:phage antirepressor KilAC domain-containing protein [Fructobacillus sp. M1-13]|uniref:Phage repressor protein/antirepressor Ant n=1 Tax=Fructobacillus papyriferae TaxID=2713171 RepID=A0ABS5QPF8_9LACO|nr:phage antirepressor KilAC domain-containing protein [Fructobacillus papyriferae]MBS9334980.1 phage repressor protein/antirepressor Ant [Fructobacillus papyriferae]MCD2159536.1 phage antirepressor KilAC domain-containing protein [Fructobacillus papyriferae]
MPNEVKTFNFESDDVRTVIINKEVWFVGKDIAQTLGYSNSNKAVQNHVDDEDKTQSQNGNEFGQRGVYMTDEKAAALISNRDNTLSDLLIQAGEQLKAKDLQISEMKSKALFADAVNRSNNSILIGQLAKILRQNGVEIGQNRLFLWMRKNGYLGTRGENYNQPTQKSVDRGIMETKVRTFNNTDGSVRTARTTKITGKGQIYFVNKLLKEQEYEEMA